MKNIINSIVIIGLFLGLICKVNAGNVEIEPVSYSFDRATDIGSYNYSDWGGVQLTDGKYGTAPRTANWGNGNAYEWVGWNNDPIVNIDFNFGSATTINKINIGTVQDHIADVVIPSFELFSSSDGINWSSFSVLNVPESSTNNNQYFTFEFNGLSINDQFIRVSLKHSNDGPWTFTDEIDFYKNTSVVPVPAAVWLFGSGLFGLIGMRKKTSKLFVLAG